MFATKMVYNMRGVAVMSLSPIISLLFLLQSMQLITPAGAISSLAHTYNHNLYHQSKIASSGSSSSFTTTDATFISSTPSLSSSTSARADGNVTDISASNSSSDAAKLVAAALEVLGERNKLRLENPNFNLNRFASAEELARSSSQGNTPSLLNFTPLNSTTAGKFKRHEANSTSPGNASSNSTFSYIIDPELAAAARIIAESTPQQVSQGNHSTVAADLRRRFAAESNDTNAMPQALVYADGLSGGYHFGDSAGRNITGGATLQPPVSSSANQSTLMQRDTASSTYWMANIPQLGSNPFAPPGYNIWRNVRDYGAKGDGSTDDTAAINRAIKDGGRCGEDCGSSTVLPAVVYFPPGIYLVSTPIIQYYNTQFLGDPLNVPTILAASSFIGLGVITSDVYSGPGPTDEWYLNTNNFLRSVKNFKIDITQTRWNAQVCAIHWQVAQGTSLENIEFHMSTEARTTQQGIYMENGSGGFLGNLVFVGGKFGAYFGNQQFTTNQLAFANCQTALQVHWDWAWTMQDVIITGCTTGLVIVGGAGGPLSTGQGVGSLVLVDAIIINTPTGIVTNLYKENSTSLLLSNVGFVNVKDAVVEDSPHQVLLPGGDSVKVKSWGFGKLNDPTGSRFVNGQDIPAMPRPDWMVGAVTSYGPQANLFSRRRPKYNDLGGAQLLDVKQYGARGDGVTDDSAILNSLLAVAANMSSIVFIPHGIYVVKDTLKVPIGSRIIGQAWSQIMGTGPKFEDASNPRAMVQVGNRGDVGVVEIQDMMFTVSGPTAGAVLVEWNVHQSSQGSAGLWG